jgi:hypothetical protein
MPGYSGTPLAKKLGIKPGFRVAFIAAPAEVLAELKPALAECEKVERGRVQKEVGRSRAPEKAGLDFAMLFPKSSAELQKEVHRLAKQIAPAGMLWVSWPKKSSGVATDVSENLVRDVGLASGLVDVKVCAVTDVWSGLKFVRRLKDR